MRQEWSPGFKLRKTAASEQIKAAHQYFGGDQELLGVWPELEGAPVLSRAFVQGSLLLLDKRAEQRNAERMMPAPADLSISSTKIYLRQRAEAIDAEEDADQLKRRLLVGLSAGLRAAPALDQAQIDAQIAAWRAQVGDLPAPDDPGYAEAAEKARLVGELEVIHRRYEQAAIMAMTVPGDLALQRLTSADLARQAATQRSALEAEAAADRLRRVLPLLPDSNAAPVRAFLEAFEVSRLDVRIEALRQEKAGVVALMASVAPPDGVEREALVTRDALAQAHLAAVQVETEPLLSAAAPADPVRARQREIAQLRLDIAEVEAALTAEHLRLVPEVAIATAEQGALETQAQVDDAQQKAADAQRKAEEAGKAELTRIATRLSALSEEFARREPVRQAEAASALDALRDAQAAQHLTVEAAFAALPLARPEALRKAYSAELQLVRRLRQAAHVRQDAVRNIVADNLRIRREKLPSDAELTDATELDNDLLSSIQASVEAVEEALDARRRQAVLEQDEVARLLRSARADGRVLREALPAVVRQSVEQTAGFDILNGTIEEATDLGPLLGEQARRMQTTDSWTIAGIVRRLILFLESSFGLIIILVAWNIARRQASGWVARGLGIVLQLLPQDKSTVRPWVEASLRGLAARLEPVVPPAVGLLAGWLVFWVLNMTSSALALLALVWVGRASLRLVQPLIEAIFVDADSNEIGVQAPPETRKLAVTSARQLVRWWIALLLLHHTTYTVLHTDLITDWVDGLLFALLALLLARELLRWSDRIAAQVDEAGDDSRLVRWMIDTDVSAVGRLMRAGAGLVLLGFVAVQRFTTFFLEGGGRMGWVGSLIAQHSLKQVDATCPPLTSDERAALLDGHEQEFLHQAEVGQIVDAYTVWCEAHRRGLVALIGDRGAGKSLLLRELVSTGAFGQHPVSSLVVTGVQEHESEARRWLSETLDISGEDGALPTWKALKQALLDRPPQVFLIDDAHRLMLRAIGGFAGLRETMTLMHATAERHFWVSAFHGPAWGFLEGSAVPINHDVFRATIRLAPMEPPRVSRWLRELMARSAHTFRFNNLMPNLPNAIDASRDLARVEAAFWRRLADVTLGNPEVLLAHWLDSLRHSKQPAGEDGQPSPLEVSLVEPPSATSAESLTDIDMFVLTAIVIHDGLGIVDIARSLNAARSQVRASCRHLESLEILSRCEDESLHFRVRPRWRPAVNRLLRQRHFLHQR